ncbi:hypothetical protein [Lysinibacillus sp. BW-2-10]|uniref:hypothetical protein n=1 Tax=Lysinibacillus sp. BW-2-10 TaxID=2590030 RepID=UPI0016431415|nr:hypothetical protein [Lysinibacillus sp. BW-2-10]
MKHGRKVEVKVEVINPKTIKITPVKSYNNGETYYLLNDLAMKNQIWMKFMVGCE